MNPKQFVTGLKTNIIDGNMSIYKELFLNTPIESTTDEYWKRALVLFQDLSTEQQAAFFEIITQIMIDTASNILGVIDGVNSIDDENNEFFLTYGDDNNALNGDLQSLLLEEVEEEKS
ncbi:hypothetical protein [Pseudomonas syringae]|uniref:hypothetical protein n=1 Tax=Pseudomonas syringae TaxID=317 RepID=UPI000466B19C|nr:hypothetical protein [Pseudomonas syringae]